MKKPIILITTSNVNSSSLESVTGDTDILYTDRATAKAVLQAGGIPIYMPAIEDTSEEALERYLSLADGVLITGADTNTNPLYYGEKPDHMKGRIDDERDRVDIAVIQSAYKKDLPTLGICKGMQLVNVALGGSLYQNISSQCNECFDHDIKKTSRANFTHKGTVEKDSLMMRIFKKPSINLNGGHEQAVKQLSSTLKATVTADDGIIEAYEGKNRKFLLGIQFHAELRVFDKPYLEIFKQFIDSCK